MKTSIYYYDGKDAIWMLDLFHPMSLNKFDAIENFNRAAAKEFNRMTVDINKAIKRIVENIRPVLIACNSVNPRVRHLAFHASKAKVRKKNMNRLRKDFRRRR